MRQGIAEGKLGEVPDRLALFEQLLGQLPASHRDGEDAIHVAAQLDRHVDAVDESQGIHPRLYARADSFQIGRAVPGFSGVEHPLEGRMVRQRERAGNLDPRLVVLGGEVPDAIGWPGCTDRAADRCPAGTRAGRRDAKAAEITSRGSR